MWDLPRPGLEPVSPALAEGFLTTTPPGKSQHKGILLVHLNVLGHTQGRTRRATCGRDQPPHTGATGGVLTTSLWGCRGSRKTGSFKDCNTVDPVVSHHHYQLSLGWMTLATWVVVMLEVTGIVCSCHQRQSVTKVTTKKGPTRSIMRV